MLSRNQGTNLVMYEVYRLTMMFMGLKYSFLWGSDEREFMSMKMMMVSENQSS
jgi:hypothetical protein